MTIDDDVKAGCERVYATFGNDLAAFERYIVASQCVCHDGSVCGPACAGRHHDGCSYERDNEPTNQQERQTR
jgi:hypothetical protein